jgi:thymidylate synthase
MKVEKGDYYNDMNNIDKQYTALLQDILDNGVKKGDRTGTGTISVFGRQIRHKMSEGFPLLTTKKMAWKTMVTELLWFLAGRTDLKWLLDHNNTIWVGDAYQVYCNAYPDVEKTFEYEGSTIETRRMTKDEFIEQIKTDDEFAKKWGELGKIYGHQWRSWTNYTGDEINEGTYEMTNEPIDQISELIKQLKDNPDSRRMVVSAWAVHDLPNMVLPPCHYGFQVYTRELSLEERYEIMKKLDNWVSVHYKEPKTMEYMDKHNIPKRAISLMWNQRSVDTFLGLPFNIASYGLLLEIIAKTVNMVPDELIGNLGDVHLYSNHIEQAKEQIGRKYTPEEREIMLKDAMSRRLYNKAVNELMPFGGGMSEYYEAYKIPNRTREPFPLPKLVINSGNENWHLLNIDEIINTFDTDITFKVDGYQSHPSIKAPLSN